MDAHEPVTSPDQHKPGTPRLARAGALGAAVALLLMTLGNHRGNIENIFLVTSAALLILALIGDWVLRRNGLR